MFGRRRHVAAAAVAPVPQLNETQIHDVLAERLSAFLGSTGEWVVSRRTTEDTDSIFQDTLTDAIACTLTAAIADATRALRTGADVEPAHRVESSGSPAPAADEDEPSEPEALEWEPSPITVWTDLRKPVTGEIPSLTPSNARQADRELVA